MDETDLQIIKILLINSRIAYRELAEKIGLSVGVVHKRVQTLVNNGVIRTFITRPSLSSLNAIIVYFFGRSQLQSIERILDDLEADPYTNFLGLSTGNYFYIGAVLKNISNMNNFTQKISELCKIEDPLILINNFPYQKVDTTLSKIDYQIVKSLNRNARKSVLEVADETGLSSKTVSKHINDMIKNKLISFTIEIEPTKENDIITIFHAKIPIDTDMNEAIKKINQSMSKSVLNITTYSNSPSMLTINVLVKTLNNIPHFENQLKELGCIDIIPSLVHKAYYFRCWLDEF